MTTYPRLPEELDLRKKLSSKDIEDIRQEFSAQGPYHTKSEISRRLRLGLPWNSETGCMRDLSLLYGVSYHTIYYWVKDDYREYKREVNARSHSKATDPVGYALHRAREISVRAERLNRYPPLREWHNAITRRNSNRKQLERR